MYSSIFQLKNLNNNGIAGLQQLSGKKNPSVINYAQNPISRPTFSALHHSIGIQSQINTNADLKKYTEVVSNLDSESKKAIDYMLKSGILLNNKSNDRTSTLDNLHRIITEQKASGLDAKNILNETVRALAKPTIINQKFGDIPEQFESTLIDYATDGSKDSTARTQVAEAHAVDKSGSSCCVAASIEFNLATQFPAEFARVAADISSPKMASSKEINLSNLCEKKEDAIWLLDNFKVPYKLKDNNKAEIAIAPDKNAFIRANIQTNYKDPTERSSVDVLMQSTFMNVGSQSTYNSLDDTRTPSFGTDQKGLVEIEKTFTESIVTDTNKTALQFQQIVEAKDENGQSVMKLDKYMADFNTIKSSLLNSLAMGENVIAGYVFLDDKGCLKGGHEITIVGTKQDANGKLIFVCNDTDDKNDELIEYSEDYLIPRIHHVGLPSQIVEADESLKAIANQNIATATA